MLFNVKFACRKKKSEGGAIIVQHYLQKGITCGRGEYSAVSQDICSLCLSGKTQKQKKLTTAKNNCNLRV